MAELFIIIGIIAIGGIITYMNENDGILAFALSAIVGMFTVIVMMCGLTIPVTPTIIPHDIKNVEIINDGYVIEYDNTKQFFNKNELEVVISDKNVLVEEKYEYSKVENQFPNNILFSPPDIVEYILQIKQK